MSDKDQAASYRLRAEELRTLAGLDDGRETNAMLLRVAQTYDGLAHAIEIAARARKSLEKTHWMH